MKKSIFYTIVFALYCIPMLQAKGKIEGLAAYLFPLPVALYNAGYDDNPIHDNKTKNYKGSFFEIISSQDVHATFQDVAGLDDVKDDLKDIINYIQQPDTYTKMGAKMPKGILMYGPPGNGKTLVARAFAGESKCSFIHVNGPDFCNSQYMGIGSQKVEELFKAAREHAPCIIFIDEIDSVGAKRGSGGNSSGMLDHNATINTMLTEMDGFDQNNKMVMVIAATNRIDQIDPAMTRPGRFDRMVKVHKPYINDRINLLKIACAQSPVADDVNFETLAHATRGFSGAELANLVNEAAILGVNDHADTITMRHFEMAYDNITLGRETKGMAQTSQNLWQTAIHEAGHLIGYIFQDTTVCVHKVSITPRGKTLGVAHMLPLTESYDWTKTDMMNRIVSCLAGREAELAFGFDLSTGAANDLEKAQQIAYDMVTRYGMANNLRDISYIQFDMQLPNDIATQIHHEVQVIIQDCRCIARNLIADHVDDIRKIADCLLQKKTVQGNEIYDLLNLPQPIMLS